MVPGTLLYTAELTWSGREGMCGRVPSTELGGTTLFFGLGSHCRANFSDSAAAPGRATSDMLGLGRRLAVASIELCHRLMSRGNSVTIRWTPAHLGAGVNKMAVLYAKGAAEGHSTRRRQSLHEGDQFRPQDGSDSGGQDQRHEQLDHQPCPPPRRMQATEGRESLDISGRLWPDAIIYQRLSRHATTGTYLCNKMGKNGC